MNQAKRHFNQLYGIVTEFRDAELERFSVHPLDGGASGWEIEVPTFNDPPPLVPLIVGDLVNNVRSALDYLVHESTRRFGNSKSRRKKTQFPICDTVEDVGGRRGFLWERKKYLSGVHPNHRALIRRAQPYQFALRHRPLPAGIFYDLSVLRRISNADKHKLLTITVGRVRYRPVGGTTIMLPTTGSGDFVATAEWEGAFHVVSGQLLGESGAPIRLDPIEFPDHTYLGQPVGMAGEIPDAEMYVKTECIYVDLMIGDWGLKGLPLILALRSMINLADLILAASGPEFA